MRDALHPRSVSDDSRRRRVCYIPRITEDWMMPNLRTPFIADATYMLEFAQPALKVRFEQARAEEAFGSIVSAQSEQTNVPDMDDPNAPRIVFNTEKKTILISQARCQLDFKFDGHLGVEATLAAIEKNASEFHVAALSKFRVAPFTLSAAVLNVQIPAESSEGLQSYIYDRFVKVKPPSEVASAQIAVGFRDGNYFTNLAADVYETRRLQVPAFLGVAYVLPNDAELISTGLRFRFDVNDRPASASAGYEVPARADGLLSTLRRFLQTNFEDLAGMPLER